MRNSPEQKASGKRCILDAREHQHCNICLSSPTNARSTSVVSTFLKWCFQLVNWLVRWWSDSFYLWPDSIICDLTQSFVTWLKHAHTHSNCHTFLVLTSALNFQLVHKTVHMLSVHAHVLSWIWSFAWGQLRFKAANSGVASSELCCCSAGLQLCCNDHCQEQITSVLLFASVCCFGLPFQCFNDMDTRVTHHMMWGVPLALGSVSTCSIAPYDCFWLWFRHVWQAAGKIGNKLHERMWVFHFTRSILSVSLVHHSTNFWMHQHCPTPIDCVPCHASVSVVIQGARGRLLKTCGANE